MADAATPAAAVPIPQTKAGERFVTNVLWSWTGVAVQLLPGFVVTPYLIFKLGDERYGIWAVVFSLVGYYALVDLGFRSAAVRYAAHFHALGEHQEINELVNTLLVYFSTMALGLVGVTVWLWQHAQRMFPHVAQQHWHEVKWLVLLAGLNLSVGVVGSSFSGCVEGFHRFDVSNRIFILSFGARSVGWFVLLYMGYGLIALGAWALFTNAALVLMYAIAFHRIFPPLQLSPARATMRMFRRTFTYGMDTFFAGMATRSMEQVTQLLIGHYMTMAAAGYYSFPLRLLQYGTDAVSKIGIVATPQTAEMAARRELDQVRRLAIFASRYCLILFMPIAIFLGFFGERIFSVWLHKPDFAALSAPLLPAMLVAYTFAMAAHFCSSSILFGLGAQRGYAVTLVAELVLNVAGTAWAVPRYGIMGAAVVTSALMLISRGVVTPWLLCRHLHASFLRYMFEILAKPSGVALPIIGALFALRQAGVTGRSIPELAALGAGIAGLYFGSCYLTCFAPEHKRLLRNWIERRIGRSQA
jgi:O-antigen/teichoic acid export membrane protein